jgi:hypothetical protein
MSIYPNRLKDGDYIPVSGDQIYSEALGLELRREDAWLLSIIPKQASACERPGNPKQKPNRN